MFFLCFIVKTRNVGKIKGYNENKRYFKNA